VQNPDHHDTTVAGQPAPGETILQPGTHTITFRV